MVTRSIVVTSTTGVLGAGTCGYGIYRVWNSQEQTQIDVEKWIDSFCDNAKASADLVLKEFDEMDKEPLKSKMKEERMRGLTTNDPSIIDNEINRAFEDERKTLFVSKQQVDECKSSLRVRWRNLPENERKRIGNTEMDSLGMQGRYTSEGRWWKTK